MVAFQVKQLTNATESQIQEIADFQAEAFYGDISIKAFVGGDWSLLRECKVAVLRACLLEGLVYIVTIGKGSEEKVVSVGCWFGNGIQLFGSEQQRALGYNTWFEKLSDETKYWLSKTYAEMITELNQSHFTKEEIAKRWWCFDLGTHPKHQGKGYATAIVKTMFKKAKAEGTFIGLGTSPEENVKKYLSMGLSVGATRGSHVFPYRRFLGTLLHDGFPCITPISTSSAYAISLPEEIICYWFIRNAAIINIYQTASLGIDTVDAHDPTRSLTLFFSIV